MGELGGVLVPEVVTQQLEALLEAGNYDGAKLLLRPVQEVDAAEAIGNLPRSHRGVRIPAGGCAADPAGAAALG